MIVTADINFRKVICPCMRVGTSRSKCFLSIRLFDTVGTTSPVDGKFPFVIYESFTFVKDFAARGEAASRSELLDCLLTEQVVITLYEATVAAAAAATAPAATAPEDIPEPYREGAMKGSLRGRPLAQFTGNALDFLFSRPTLRPPKTGTKDFALRPLLLASKQFTDIFRVEPELLFCTHVVVRDSRTAAADTMTPSREQLVSRLIAAQLDQRSVSPECPVMDPAGMEEAMPLVNYYYGGGQRPGERRLAKKRIQTVKRKCYMCELRRSYLEAGSLSHEIFRGEEVLPPPPPPQVAAAATAAVDSPDPGDGQY